MKITVEINTDNAAFDNCPAAEVSRILRNVAAQIADYGLQLAGFGHASENAGSVREPVYDTNGNTCGYVTVSAHSEG